MKTHLEQILHILNNSPYGWHSMVSSEAKEVEKILSKMCKETAKNVRHKACDLVAEFQPLGVSEVQKEIMNIQFNDVKPK